MNLLARKQPKTTCHGTETPASGRPILAIVGCPNVGKSVLFNRLTGAYVTVSNYPGTTVEVTRGKARLGGTEVEVVDTPGMYALLPISEEEAVARRLLLEEHPRHVLHVVDAKNLQRMLPLTLQLLEAGLPVTLALNLLDESESLGFAFDFHALAETLGVPVFGTVGASNRGVKELEAALGTVLRQDPLLPRRLPEETEEKASGSGGVCLVYDTVIEDAIEDITEIIDGLVAITPRAAALLLLQGDKEVLELVRTRLTPEAAAQIVAITAAAQKRFAQPLNIVITLRRQAVVNSIIAQVMQSPGEATPPRLEWFSRLLMHPIAGLPVLALVLYFGIFKFVGVFGAGTLVDLLENKLFGNSTEGLIIPHLTRWLEQLFGKESIWTNLFVHDYGIISLGITYAVAIVLPIVGLFFFVFAILEDSGYLPRLAMLIDRLFKAIGLNGRAVIPLVLGFGCDTMATMTTRVLETRRERIIATLLLALAIPCSAQSGLFLAMLSTVQPYGLLIYIGVLILIFLATGFLASRLVPGQRAQFYIELPPLRLPRLGNVLTKTYTRLEWYFIEILPMFILASVVLWIGSLAIDPATHKVIFSPHHGLFGVLERALDPLGAVIGLPTSADVARNPALQFTGGTILLAGFFRRDFGAAGLLHLFKSGLISPVQVVVSAVTLTLFLPCVAQFLVMKKERGLWTAIGMATFVLVVAFGTGYLLRLLLTVWHLPLVMK